MSITLGLWGALLPPASPQPALSPSPLCAHLSPLCMQRMVKTSEKPRLRQIPSSEDMEAEGMEAGAESSEQARARVEPTRPGSSGKEPERPQKMLQPQEELILQQVSKEWQGDWGCKKWNSQPPSLHFRTLLFYISWCRVKFCTNPAASWSWRKFSSDPESSVKDCCLGGDAGTTSFPSSVQGCFASTIPILLHLASELLSTAGLSQQRAADAA